DAELPGFGGDAFAIILKVGINHPDGDPLVRKFSAERAELGDALARDRAAIARKEEHHHFRVGALQFKIFPMIIKQAEVHHLFGPGEIWVRCGLLSSSGCGQTQANGASEQSEWK